MACTGWTWAEVGRLTVPRYLALADYWRRHPPLHLLVAASVGHLTVQNSDFSTFFRELTGASPPA